MTKISDFVYPELQTTQMLSFTGENFLIWKLKLSFVLADYQLSHLMEPSPAHPAAAQNEENVAVAKWIIFRTLDDSLRMEFCNYPTLESIMETLLTRFNSLLTMSPDIKLRDYTSYRMASDAHINQHIFRMRAMAKELEYGAGVKIPDKVQAVFLLNSLPDDWEADVEGLLMDLGQREEDLSFLNFSRRLSVLQDVRKLRKFSHREKWKKRAVGPCYSCGRKGHYKADCPYRGSSEQESSSPNVAIPMDATLSELIYLSLKSCERIDYKGSKFNYWKGQIYTVLRDNEVDYVLKEPEPEPDPAGTTEEYAHHSKKWHVDDFTCRHLILGTMEDDVFLSFHDCPNAKALMDALEAFFNSTSTAQKLVKLKKYMNHCMAEDTSVMSHIIKMDWMVSRLGKLGMDIPSEMQSVFLLDSLPESWSETEISLRLNLSSDRRNNAWSFDNVRKRIIDAGDIKELRGRQEDSRFDENANGNRKNKQFRRGNCYSCGRSGHYQSNCPDLR